MSWIRVYIHVVFSTKNREPFLNSNEIRKIVFTHIKRNAAEKGIWLDCVNGYQEHAHCLISLGREQSISKIAQLIKGESSYWINKNKLTVNKFAWQDDYWATCISEMHIQVIRNYIHDQEEHHAKKSFTEEVEIFMKESGLTLIRENK